MKKHLLKALVALMAIAALATACHKENTNEPLGSGDGIPAGLG